MSRNDPKVTLMQVANHARKAQALCAKYTLSELLIDWEKRAAWPCLDLVDKCWGDT